MSDTESIASSDVSNKINVQEEKIVENSEREYIQLTQLQHVKERSGMYIGSTSLQEAELYILNDSRTNVTNTKVKHSPALLKIFDEIISNCVDHHIKNHSTVKNIRVYFKDGEVKIFNDGPGIIIKLVETQHDGKMWKPQAIFTQFLSGDNFSKTENRVVAGLNGLGAKLTNAFSKYFIVETLDKVEKKHYTQKFSNGMETIDKPKMEGIKDGDKPFTQITFFPDYTKLGYEKDPSEEEYQMISRLFETRSYETAAFIGKTCDIYFNDNLISMDSTPSTFYNFTKMFLQETDDIFHIVLKHDGKDRRRDMEICIAPSSGKSQSYSLVNNVVITSGNHLKYIEKEIVDAIKPFAEKETAKMIKGGLSSNAPITNNLFIFIRTTVINPEFDSQSKTKLVNPSSEFNCFKFKSTHNKKIWEVVGPNIINAIVGKMTDKKKTKVTRSRIYPTKGNDAKFAGNKTKAKDCTLFIAEGDSALGLVNSGISHEKTSLSIDYCGTWSVQGVPPNARKEVTIRENKTQNTKHIIRSDRLQENKRFKELVYLLGLDYQKSYDITPEGECEFETLRYGRVVVATDQDVDGSGQIFGLLLNFFSIFWPKLIERGYVTRFNTPIIRAYPKTNSSNGKEFYTLHAFNSWIAEKYSGDVEEASKSWKIKYYKGLASHDRQEIQPTFNNFEEKLYIYTFDPTAEESLDVYFGKDTGARKVVLSTPVSEDDIIKEKVREVPVTQFLSTNVKEFQRDNILRKLPSLLDGMVPSRRKAFYVARLNKSMANEPVKVASFTGEVMSKANYLHGDASLSATIIKMAQDFVGAKNLPLLIGVGQFGDRINGPEAAGSPRYVCVKLNKALTDLLMPPQDDFLLPYVFDEGKRCEPQYYVPILPLAVMENQNIPATGWKIKVWARDYKDVIRNVRKMISGDYTKCKKMGMWLRDNKSEVRVGSDKKEYLVGCYEMNKNTVTITELPPGVYANKYIKTVAFTSGGELRPEFKNVDNYSNYNEETHKDKIKIVFEMMPNVLDELKQKYENKLSSGKKSKKKASQDDEDDEEASYDADQQFDFVEDFFKLRLRADSHLNMINQNGEVNEIEFYGTIVNTWFDVRKSLYIQRTERMIILTQAMIKYLENILRFVRERETLNISKETSEDEFCKILEENDYDRFNKTLLFSPKYTKVSELEALIINGDGCSYDYVMSLSYRSLLSETNKKREDELKEEKKKLKRLLEESKNSNGFKGQKTWLSEIDQLENVIDNAMQKGWSQYKKVIFH